ncbi:uncharacterized protein LOC144664126 isoform X3 [Oculina patagonica]
MADISVERSPRRRRRKISENVRELHGALTKVLNNEDRTFLIQSLNQYQREKNVNNLVVSLKSVLDSPRKREVYPLLRQIIPHHDQENFCRLWEHSFEARQRSKSPARSPANLRRIPTSSSLPDNLHRHASDSGIDLPNLTQYPSSRPDVKHPIKRITIKRHSNAGFGFCIRGGAEHGVGLYVSSVDENSVAETEGLLPGDHIFQVNGTKFDGLTHAQAVKIIQSSKKLNLTVRSVGRIPISFVAESTCKWVDMRGRRASPPPGVDSNGRILTADGIHKSDLRLLGDDDERKVNIFVEDGAKLGLMIRGGSDYGLGIYIAGVDPDCIAEQAGLKAGDQILDVNGQSFLNISHKKAVKVLKSTKSMILTLKDIGRLPFTRVTHDKTKWVAKSPKNGQIQRRHTTVGRIGHEGGTEPSMFHHGIAGSQVLYNGGLPCQKNLITEQARQILNDNELGTLKYYLDEYCKGYIKISAFVLALFDLLDTAAKMSLMFEIRGSVAPRDLDRFDDLVLKKEIEVMKSRQFFGDHIADDRQSVHSYASSVSSFSGKGSSSSRSSAKGSLDGTGSRPITPPQVPEVLPPNVKVEYDVKSPSGYDVYEATLTFKDDQEEIFDAGDFEGLPNFLTIDPMSLDLPVTESTSVLSRTDVSTPPLTSSPSNEPHGQVSPTQTKGEATASLQVGDNTRTQNKDVKSSGLSEKGVKKDQSSSSGHTYVNADVRSSGKLSPLSDSIHCDTNSSAGVHQSKKKSEKPQSPPNPFIFPSTFPGSTIDTQVKPTEESLTNRTAFSEPTQQNGNTRDSPRENVITQSDAQPKHNQRKQGVVSEIPDNDLRPEVAKLPGRKRVASWGTPQEDETEPVTNGPQSMKSQQSKDSLSPTGSGSHLYTNGDRTDGLTHQRGSENAGCGNGSMVPTRAHLHNQFSDASSESSSPSDSRRSSVTKNRKSWDGVRHPGESDENQKVSRLERPKDNKERSCSDSNLMNLPKEQQKEIQAKHRASQELYELHQQSKTKANPSHQMETNTLETRGRVSTSPKMNGVGESVFVVEVDKSAGSLGLTLEGGSDTGGDVKIKSIKEGNFAAWKCGVLKAGQILLQVDDTPLRGMTSGIAVLTLRHAYSSPDSGVLKLLVRDV